MNASQSDSVASSAESLVPAYRLLARLYLESPDAHAVESLQQWCSALDAESMSPAVADAAETVVAASADLDALRGAFTRLLQGVSFGTAVAPPYESLYIDGVLNGPSSTEVDAFYREAGFELAVEDELIDHAGYELAFLAELCERGDTERQRAFIRTHVGSWISEFHDAATDREPPELYRGSFALTEALLDLHAETVAEDDG